MTAPLVAARTMAPGQPRPLGAHCCTGGTTDAPAKPEAGVNFAVWAPEATRVELCLFDDAGDAELQRFDLPAFSDGVWHGFLPGAAPGLVYGLRAHGPWAPHQGHRFNPAKVLLDPWAREVVGRYDAEAAPDLHLGHRVDDPMRLDRRDNAAHALKARVAAPLPAKPRLQAPRIARERSVLYEVHVKGLTRQHPEIPPALRGSYAALAHPVMLEHYRRLGVTTLNLLPVQFRADEAALQQRGLVNYWGYSTIAYLAPETRYWSGREGTTPAGEFRDMVDALHGAGLELVLDVVYNHTAEGDEHGPTLSMRGLANSHYYHLAGKREHYLNWTGCGNSLNLTEARVVELVIGSLRHWVEAFGVDGFRFDLATTLARDRHGHFSHAAGFFAALQADPVLADVKWIAEPWDVGAGGYQLGAFPAGWAEWNDKYRDTMRDWWLRGSGDRGVFAHCFAASSAQFHHGGRAPTASVNFITAHDGFTLRDLVSYDHKHNLDNGEFNHDGHQHNNSWNCGVEGPTDDAGVLALRARLQRALLASLLTSQGTPMLLAGDEIGHSQRGNNNAYCQDNPLTWLDWAGRDAGLLDCVRALLALRHEHRALRQGTWLSSHPDPNARQPVMWWHPDGRMLEGADWSEHHDRALAIRLQAVAGKSGGDTRAESRAVLLLINPNRAARRFRLPPGRWQPVFDSHAEDGVPPAPLAELPDGIQLAQPAMLSVPARCLMIMLGGDDAAVTAATPDSSATRPETSPR